MTGVTSCAAASHTDETRTLLHIHVFISDRDHHGHCGTASVRWDSGCHGVNEVKGRCERRPQSGRASLVRRARRRVYGGAPLLAIVLVLTETLIIFRSYMLCCMPLWRFACPGVPALDKASPKSQNSSGLWTGSRLLIRVGSRRAALYAEINRSGT